jgi:hypothetical protein
MPIHFTASGSTIAYTPTPAVAAVLDRLKAMLRDPQSTAGDMIRVAYAPDNPLVDVSTMLPCTSHERRAMVDPAYLVMTDLLYRKQSSESGVHRVVRLEMQHAS